MPRITKTAALAGVAGAAAIATVGLGASQALADTTPTPSASSTTQSGEAPSIDAPAGRGERGGPWHGKGGMKGADASALATALGIDEAKVKAAIEKVREANKPSEKPAEGMKPTEAEREARQTAYIAELAKELGVTTDKVTAAIDKVRAAHEAERQTALSDKLDAAVKAGTLTEADKASVLKAVEAGVLGGPGPR